MQRRYSPETIPKNSYNWLIISYHDILVGGVPTPLKNMKVSWDDSSQYIMENNPNVPNHQPE